MIFKWDREKERLVIELRKNRHTYKAIAEKLGTTATSVKHKVRRLQQSDNQDRYKHTREKTAQFLSVSNDIRCRDLNILETHSGFGGMSEVYSQFGEVEGYDIDMKRVDYLNNKGHENIQAIKGDSEQELYRLVAHRCNYDIVDIDPYGLPSRYFPHAFALIRDGLMFLTFPMMGVAQINKITIRHYKAFWGIELSDKEVYVDKIKERLEEFAFQHKREITFLDVRKIDRIYRFAIKVERKSLCDVVGLVVNRRVLSMV